MLRKPGTYDPSKTASTSRAQSSNRRKTAEGPDDIVKRLLRLPGNKNCADCSARAPRAANLTHGTFVCLPCCGVHREFSHRIKGIGHSAFTTEEATFLSANGNDIINAKYLANFRSGSERLRAPDGSTGNVDGQLLRVWLRRKYIDGAWAASSVSQQNGGGSQNHNLQPTRAQIPPKKKATPAQASVPDLLGGGWDSAPVPAAPAPVVNDAAWDAFGQSRSSTASFKPDFGSQPEANQQPVSQANFGQMPSQAPPPAPVPVPVPASSFQSSNQQSPDPPQQQTQQYSFNPNIPQPSTPNRSAPPAPAYGASFPGRQLPSLPAQQMNGSPYQDKFQQQSSAQNQVPVSQQAQQQQTTVQSQQGFNANFQQGQQQPVDHVQQNQQGFNANFQQGQQGQQQPVDQVQQNQHGFNASFQQQPAAQLQQNQQGFNANFQQGQQQPVDHVQQNQQGFNANFQQGQQQPVDHVQQNQHGFNANFQQGQQQPVDHVQQNQHGFNANFQQGQQQPVDHVHQNQQGFNANFQQGQQQPVDHVRQNQQGLFNANFQQGQQQPVDHVQQNQQGFNANFQQGQQQPVDHVQQNQQGLFNANFQNPAAQLPQNQASMQVVSHDEGQLQQNQQNLQTHVQSPEPQKQVVLDEKAAANQSQPAMPIEVSGSTDNVNSGPADSNSMHSSSAIDARVSADPFDAFNDLGIGSSSAPSSQRNDPPSPPDPSPTPPNMTANSTAKYQVGQKLEYRDSENNISLVEVLKAHLDDSLVPFYDIKMENGREKQTDDGHLSHQSASLVSKNALLGIVTTLLSNLDEHQLRAVENFVKDMKGIQS